MARNGRVYRQTDRTGVVPQYLWISPHLFSPTPLQHGGWIGLIGSGGKLQGEGSGVREGLGVKGLGVKGLGVKGLGVRSRKEASSGLQCAV